MRADDGGAISGYKASRKLNDISGRYSFAIEKLKTARSRNRIAQYKSMIITAKKNFTKEFAMRIPGVIDDKMKEDLLDLAKGVLFN